MSYVAQRLDHPPVLVPTARGQLEDETRAVSSRLATTTLATQAITAFEELLSRVKALASPISQSVYSSRMSAAIEDMLPDSETHSPPRVGAKQNLSLTPKERPPFAAC